MTAACWILGAVFILGGLTATAAGLTGGSWFFSAASAHTFTGRRHLRAARALYAIAGLLMIAAGWSLLPL